MRLVWRLRTTFARRVNFRFVDDRGEIISSETPRLSRVEARHPFPFGPCVVTYHVIYYRIITLYHDRPIRRRQLDINS